MTKKTIITTLSFILILSAHPAHAQNKKAAKRNHLQESREATTAIDKVVQRCGYGQAGAPGLSVIVIRDGKVLGQRSYGLANEEEKAIITTRTNFRIASVSKQFTAMAIMILKERGKLNFESKISEFFPEFPVYGKDITLRQLLNHTSGLRNYEDYIPGDQHSQITDTDVLRILESETSGYFLPGKGYQYSNSGYILLALIVEKVSGQDFSKFLKENIFQPIGMSSSLVFEDKNQQILNRAFGYSLVAGEYQRADQSITSGTYGDGGIYSSVADLFKWDQALYTSKLVSAASLAEAFTPGSYGDGQHSDYGFGWSIDVVKGYVKFSHEGATIGFRSYIMRLPEQKFSVIVLMNLNDGDPVRVANGIARIYYPHIAVEQPAVAKLNPNVLRGYTGFFEARGGISYFKPTVKGLRWIGVTSTPIDLLPQADGKFFYADPDLNPDGAYRLSFHLDAQGKVNGFNFEVNGRADFQGTFLCPLTNEIDHSQENDPPVKTITNILNALAKGGQAVKEVTGITDGLRSDLLNSPQTNLTGLRSIIYLSQADVSSRMIERHGAKVASICFYKMSLSKGSQLVLTYLTKDGLVTDEDVVDEP